MQTFQHFLCCRTALRQSLCSELLSCRQEMSGQQISAFAQQIGDIPSHPSCAATAQFHPRPSVCSVAEEMLAYPECKVYVCICLSMSMHACGWRTGKKGRVIAWVPEFVLYTCVYRYGREKKRKPQCVNMTLVFLSKRLCVRIYTTEPIQEKLFTISIIFLWLWIDLAPLRIAG